MQPFERWLLSRTFLHWHSLSKNRGKALRFLRDPILRWKQFARQQRLLREARRAVRTCRINCNLDICLSHLAKSKIAAAAEVGRWLDTKQPAHVPLADRLDQLLDEYKQRSEPSPGESTHVITTSPKQLHIRGKEVTLSEPDLAGLMALKQFHWLLSHVDGRRDDTVAAALRSQPTHTALSPLDRLKSYVKLAGAVFDNNFRDPSALPEVHVLDLIGLADDIQSTLEKFSNTPPDVNRGILEQHYVKTGVEDISTKEESRSRLDKALAEIDPNAGTSDLFDAEEERLFAKYLSEVSPAEEDPERETEQASLVDELAMAAEVNLHAMKLDVDRSLLDACSSETHLANYHEFIEKKKKQRTMCLRDIKEHCCICRGPHIGKPPFSHAKGYRREPTHTQHRGTKCLFLKKKRSELKWLDETIGNFARNDERFEREIEKRQAEAERRKDAMKEELAANLRLLELASG